VAAAAGRNPIAVVVPCHRVVGSDGSLTGYAGGLARKRFLLDLERPAHGRGDCSEIVTLTSLRPRDVYQA
jgi:methylated-DNA-[protein]-cysteine S-methyltransferase